MKLLLILLLAFNSYAADDFYGKANKYLKDGKLEMAMIYYQKAIQQDPENGDAYHRLGNIYYGKKDYQNSLLNFLKTEEIKPNFPQNLRAIACSYAQLKDVNKAFEYFQKVLKIDKNFAYAYLDMGTIYLRQLADKPKTIENWETFLVIAPNDVQSDNVRRALAYLKDPNFEMPKPIDNLSGASNTTASSNGLQLPNLDIEGKDLKAPSDEKNDAKKRKGIATE